MKIAKQRSVRVIIVSLLVLVLAFALAGCGNNGSGSGSGSGSSGDAAEKTMEEILLSAAKNIQDAESMTYDMNMDMGMNLFGMKMDTLMNGTIETIQNPLSMHMEGTTDMGALGSYDMEMYAETEGDQLVMYTGVMLDEDVQWIKEVADIDSASLSQYNAQSNISVYVDNAKNFTRVGDEEVNGVTCARFDGVISGESIEKVISESGMGDQLAGMGVENPEEYYSDIDDIPLSFWVDVENEMLLKYEIDMSATMKSMVDKAIEEHSKDEDVEGTDIAGMVSIDKSVISVTVTGINNVDSITIPDSVKENAQTAE